MKKMLLMGAVVLSVFAFGQKSSKIDLKSYDTKSIASLKSRVANDENLLDFKIDSVGTKYLTRKQALVTYLSYLSNKSNESMAKYDLEKTKVNSLPARERLAKLDELKEILMQGFSKEKQLILLDKIQTADDKNKFLILTTLLFNIKIKDGIDGDYESQYYYKLNGEKIENVYNYLVLNP